MHSMQALIELCQCVHERGLRLGYEFEVLVPEDYTFLSFDIGISLKNMVLDILLCNKHDTWLLTIYTATCPEFCILGAGAPAAIDRDCELSSLTSHHLRPFPK